MWLLISNHKTQPELIFTSDKPVSCLKEELGFLLELEEDPAEGPIEIEAVWRA